MQTDPKKIKAVSEFPTPINRRKVKQIMRKSLTHFTKFPGNKKKIVWGDTEMKAFEARKKPFATLQFSRSQTLASPSL